MFVTVSSSCVANCSVLATVSVHNLRIRTHNKDMFRDVQKDSDDTVGDSESVTQLLRKAWQTILAKIPCRGLPLRP